MEKTYKVLKLMIWILLFAVFLTGAWVLYNSLSRQMTPETMATQNSDATLAPDFIVYDGDGNAVSLSDFRGKPVILNFWASWCGPCKSEMPEFQAAFESYGDDIHFVMVDLVDNHQESQKQGQALISANDYTFPVYFDTDMDAAVTYGVNAIPATYFLDENGYLVTSARGALNKERLQQGIDLLIKEDN